MKYETTRKQFYEEKLHEIAGEIAEKLNMQDSNFSRLLRHELPEDKKQQIRAIIDDMKC